jgi:hypothetical protein
MIVGKQARSRRLSAAAQPSERGTIAGHPRLKLGILAGLVVVLVIGLATAAIAFAAATTTAGSGSLPQGTQVFAESDHSHVNGSVTYDHVPPAGGPHNPVPLNCGIYTVPVPNENAVHSLEHGTVWITYEPNLPVDQVAALRQLVASHYVGTVKYLILSPYAGIPSPIVASAWGYQLGVDQASDSRLVQFIGQFAGGGQGGEKGAACTGGLGNPQ